MRLKIFYQNSGGYLEKINKTDLELVYLRFMKGVRTTMRVQRITHAQIAAELKTSGASMSRKMTGKRVLRLSEALAMATILETDINQLIVLGAQVLEAEARQRERLGGTDDSNNDAKAAGSSRKRGKNKEVATPEAGS
jgi:hypothetical protein